MKIDLGCPCAVTALPVGPEGSYQLSALSRPRACDVDAVLAEHGQDPLRIVGCDYRDRTFAQVEDEPDVFARSMSVEVKPVAKIGTAPDSPVAESEAAKLYLSDRADLRIKHPLWTQE